MPLPGTRRGDSAVVGYQHQDCSVASLFTMTVKLGTRLVPAGQNFAASPDRLRGALWFSFLFRIKRACEAFSMGAAAKPLQVNHAALFAEPLR
jgi:hypothetical protein